MPHWLAHRTYVNADETEVVAEDEPGAVLLGEAGDEITEEVHDRLFGERPDHVGYGSSQAEAKGAG